MLKNIHHYAHFINSMTTSNKPESKSIYEDNSSNIIRCNPFSGAKFVAVVDNSIKHVYFDGVNQGGSVGWHKAFVAQLHDDVKVNL